MQFKTYVLSDSMNVNPPIFQRVNKNQRVRLNKIPTWQPYLQVTFIDKDGRSKTHRYKSNTDELDQSKQIKDHNIPANERYTTSERNDLIFRHGVLITAKPTAQKFLEAYPGCEGFEGLCDAPGVFPGQFRLLDKQGEMKTSNEEFRKRAKAAVKIADLTLPESQELLIRLNGAFYRPSDDIEENVKTLVDYLDEAEEEGIDLILSEDINVDDKMELMIGKLLNAGVLLISEESGLVQKKSAGNWVDVRKFSDNHSMDEKKRLFIEYLNSPAGADLKSDLEKELIKVDAKHKGIGMPVELPGEQYQESEGEAKEEVKAKRGPKPKQK